MNWVHVKRIMCIRLVIVVVAPTSHTLSIRTYSTAQTARIYLLQIIFKFESKSLSILRKRCLFVFVAEFAKTRRSNAIPFKFCPFLPKKKMVSNVTMRRAPCVYFLTFRRDLHASANHFHAPWRIVEIVIEHFYRFFHHSAGAHPIQHRNRSVELRFSTQESRCVMLVIDLRSSASRSMRFNYSSLERSATHFFFCVSNEIDTKHNFPVANINILMSIITKHAAPVHCLFIVLVIVVLSCIGALTRFFAARWLKLCSIYCLHSCSIIFINIVGRDYRLNRQHAQSQADKKKKKTTKSSDFRQLP